MPARPEEALHRQVVRFLTVATQPADGVWFTHAPNGGKRTKAEGGILKAMGTKAGTPDILIVCHGRALWIELKAPTGRLSPAQNTTIRHLDMAGAPVAVCRTLVEVEDNLRRWGVPLRATCQ